MAAALLSWTISAGFPESTHKPSKAKVPAAMIYRKGEFFSWLKSIEIDSFCKAFIVNQSKREEDLETPSGSGVSVKKSSKIYSRGKQLCEDSGLYKTRPDDYLAKNTCLIDLLESHGSRGFSISIRS